MPSQTTVSQVNPNDSVSQIGVSQHEARVTKRGKTSVVYQHSSLITVNGIPKQKCNYCREIYDCKQATSSLLKHLNTHDKFKRRGDSVSGADTSLSRPSPFTRKDKPRQFSEDAFAKILVRMAVLGDYPFSFVDCEEVRDLIELLRPQTKVMGRSTLRKQIAFEYKKEQKAIIAEFDAVSSKISFTLDAWTSKNQKCFLGNYLFNNRNLCSLY
jgi:hypothetical protein